MLEKISVVIVLACLTAGAVAQSGSENERQMAAHVGLLLPQTRNLVDPASHEVRVLISYFSDSSHQNLTSREGWLQKDLILY